MGTEETLRSFHDMEVEAEGGTVCSIKGIASILPVTLHIYGIIPRV
jgi:hypothetical protein